jgi:hypothetical protein
MRLDYALVAEGVGLDARGALTLIAVDQLILLAPTLPIPVSRVLVMRAIEEKDEFQNAAIALRLTVVSPAGETISASSGMGALGPRLFDDVPGILQVQSAFSFLATEYGKYEVKASVTDANGNELAVSVPLYVRRPIPPSPNP